ncbi:hypothetical protein [Sporosarcina beigongshangi]|uniref:hypothetical protein n=1 Tax=Sporosarcina beigongshangi TaxID=2782538 RepID=UPI00193998CC|nr:hypothetical protein [Sporosarcina beigongshangi]
MREDRNPDRQNRLDQQDRRDRETRDRDREIDSVEFGNDFFNDLPDRTETRDRNPEKNNERKK